MQHHEQILNNTLILFADDATDGEAAVYSRSRIADL